MQVYTGKVEGRNLAAAPWEPHEAFAGSDGQVQPEFLWSVLDCPGAWAVIHHSRPEAIVLGKLTGRIIQPVWVGQPYLVMGWWIRSDGRKNEAGTAVFTESGDLCAAGHAIWIALR